MAAGFKQATVNASLVPATQTDFPSYVDLSRIGITNLAEAQSVRVYADSAKTTEWAREIVSATEMHVKVPSLTSTTSIYVDWDGVRADYAVTDTYGRNAVWSSNYGAVYHLNNVNDSSGNGYTLTNNNSTAFNSQLIGDGGDTGSGNTTKSLSHDVNGPVGISSTQFGTSWTIGGWFNVYDVSGFEVFHGIQVQRVSPSGRRQYRIARDGAVLKLSIFDGASNLYTTSQTLSINTWYHIVVTYDGSKFDVYLNGSNVLSQTRSLSYFSDSQAGGFGIFASRLGSGNFDVLSARGDEVYSNTDSLPANWITTEYNNQSNESSFWGTWTDVGGGAARRIFVVS